MAVSDAIYIKKYNDIPIDNREILRYAGIMGVSELSDDSLSRLVNEVIDECKDVFAFRLCYRRLPVTRRKADGNELQEFPGLEYPFVTDSIDLQKCLINSDECIMLAATAGHEIDRLITRYQRFEPSRALIMQAFGAERIESMLDVFCDEMEAEISLEGLHITPRFSPGYGDLPLETQRDFFRILDISHQIGISLGDSLLMRPSKSVTAIMGITDKCKGSNPNKCSACKKTNCTYRG